MEKLGNESDLFRKFYSRNLADERVEHTAEIETVYQDLGKAFKAKDNFITRGMEELTGIINNHLKVENLFTYKKLEYLEEEDEPVDEEKKK